MEIPFNPDSNNNQFQTPNMEIIKEKKPEVQQVQKQQIQEQPQKIQNQIQVPPEVPKQEETPDSVLIGIYLKKEKNSIDYAYDRENLDLILFNRNLIIGLLQNITFDLLTAEKPENE